MKKYILVTSAQSISWKSCRTISANLLTAYCTLFPKIKILKQPMTQLSDNFSRRIIKERPDKIIFIDHQLNFSNLKMQLEIIQKTLVTNLPEIVFHIFGDFTFFSNEWIKLENVLTFFAVKFITASSAQNTLLQKLINNNSSIITCPFPVNSQQYCFKPSSRNKIRKSLNIPNEACVFFYSGRISLQKRVLDLLLIFDQYLQLTGANAYLVVLGPFDDYGDPLKGIWYLPNMFQKNFKSIIKKISPANRERIIQLNEVDTKKMVHYYSMADIFVSLSTHNDEDFGMAPAEALCTGLPTILSNWGGYKDFKLTSNDKFSRKIPVHFNLNQIRLANHQVVKELIEMEKQLSKIRKDRIKRSSKAISILGIEKAIKRISKITAKKPQHFQGFTPAMHQLAQDFNKSKSPYIDKNGQLTSLFSKIYEDYK